MPIFDTERMERLYQLKLTSKLVLIYLSGKFINSTFISSYHRNPVERSLKVSFLRCYTQNMKERSVNQTGESTRQKHSLTHLWNNVSHHLTVKCCDVLWPKLWSRYIWLTYFHVCCVHFPKSKTDISTSALTMISSGPQSQKVCSMLYRKIKPSKSINILSAKLWWLFMD